MRVWSRDFTLHYTHPGAMDTKIGMAAFFTNIEESQPDPKAPFKFELRKGAEEDKKNFESVFFETFGLEPLTGNTKESSVINLTRKQWKHANHIDNCTNCWVCRLKNADYSKCEYVMLGFSSHGNEEQSADGVRQPTVILSDGHVLVLSEIVRALDIESLKNKPKILMLLSCRVYDKPPEIFDIEIPKVDETTTISTAIPEISELNKNDTDVVLRVTHQADKIGFEVQQATQTTEWTIAKLKDDEEEIDRNTAKITVVNLQSDTTYCFVVRAEYAKGFGPFSKMITIRTLEADDEGGEVMVEKADEKTETAHGEDGNDGNNKLTNFIKKTIGYKSTKKAVPDLMSEMPLDGGGSGDRNASSNPPMSKTSRFQAVKVDEKQLGDDSKEGAANKEVFSPDNLPNDFLIVYGTTRGRLAKRHEQYGSWLMHSLTGAVAEEEGKELYFFHLLTKVAKLMADRKSEHETIQKLRNKKNSLCFSHTLTEDIIFKKKALSKPDL